MFDLARGGDLLEALLGWNYVLTIEMGQNAGDLATVTIEIDTEAGSGLVGVCRSCGGHILESLETATRVVVEFDALDRLKLWLGHLGCGTDLPYVHMCELLLSFGLGYRRTGQI